MDTERHEQDTGPLASRLSRRFLHARGPASVEGAGPFSTHSPRERVPGGLVRDQDFDDQTAPEVGRKPRRRAWRMLALLVPLAFAALIAGFVFEELEVRDPARPVTLEPFALKDAQGRTHEPTDWRDAKAVVLFVIGDDCP